MNAAPPRYADTRACPDCRSSLPAAPDRCPTCGLPLQGFLADRLLTTLREADDLLARLRASAVSPSAPAAAPATSAPPERPARRGLQGASVPRILLGLGATCLLVAAVIFSAVAWTWLGIGGRTAVLVGLTGATGAAGAVLGRRGLSLAAEALTTVALGLVVLDLLGADDAGWFGDLSVEGLVRLVGVALLVPGVALSLRPGRLVVPQLAAPAGLMLVLATVGWSRYAVGVVDVVGPVSVLALAALAALAHRVGAPVLAWVAGCLAVVAWGGATLWALSEAAANPTLRGLWVLGHGWELTLMTVLSLLLWAAAWSEPLARQGCAAVVALVATYLVVLPGLDGTPTQVTCLFIAVLVVWTLVAGLTPPSWSAVPRVPLVGAAAVPVVSALTLLGHAAHAVATVGTPFSRSAAVRLVPADQPLHPLLLLASVAALAFAVLFAAPRVRWTVPAVVGGLGLAGVATLGLHPVPLWVLLATVAVGAVALFVVALPRQDHLGLTLAVATGAAAGIVTLAALPSLVLTTIAVALVVVGLVATLVTGRFASAAEVGGLGLPVALGALLWCVAELAEVDPALRGAPILLAVGLLAVCRPRIEVEAAAAATGLLAAATAIPYAADTTVSLALHLTLAGALVTGSSILHPSRRLLAWPGGVLLACATWVRLADLGVTAPEPYTLPAAVVLLFFGLHRIRVADDAPTASALGPGLVLASVPSLLWVLADPVTMRAALLGTACLALLLTGVALRWHAPVIVGALVGGGVVLRELAPYALETPQWVLIGLAGAVLVACGITWESRMRDLQHATRYLDRLR